jgi:hypothetical protein
MSSYPNSIPRCEHIKVNGTQCGSPALRSNHFCFCRRFAKSRSPSFAIRFALSRIRLGGPASAA